MKITNLILAYFIISVCIKTTFGMDQLNSMNSFAVLGAANNISPIRLEFNNNSSKKYLSKILAKYVFWS